MLQAFVGKYRLCQQYQADMPCKVPEHQCAFAHNQAEVDFWTADRDGQLVFNDFYSQHVKVTQAASKLYFSTEYMYISTCIVNVASASSYWLSYMLQLLRDREPSKPETMPVDPLPILLQPGSSCHHLQQGSSQFYLPK